MRLLASVLCFMFLWQMSTSFSVLFKCLQSNGDAFISRDFRLNNSVAVAVAAPVIGVSVEQCAEICCANEGCNALEFQHGSDIRQSTCMQFACNDPINCQKKTVDREIDVTVAVWLEKKVSSAMAGAYFSASGTETSMSTVFTQISLSSELQTMAETAITPTGQLDTDDPIRPSYSEAVVDGVYSEAKIYAISVSGEETPSDSKVLAADDDAQSNTDKDLFRKLVGDRLAEETARKPQNLWSNITVGMCAFGLVLFGLLLLLIATLIHPPKDRTRYMSLP